MKMKSFALVALIISSVFLCTNATFANQDNDDSMQVLADNSNSNGNTNGNANTNSSNTEEDLGSPDTATGDDDY